MSANQLIHFLLVFDHKQGKLVDVPQEFTDAAAAVAAYSAKERDYDGTSGVEIVLIGSDSYDTVKITHANYFDGTVATSKYLVGL